MRQKRAHTRTLLCLAVLILAGGALFAEAIDDPSVVADTSFAEPVDRPENPEDAHEQPLAEPVLPAPAVPATSDTPDPATDSAGRETPGPARDDEDQPGGSEDAARPTGVVDGEQVGVLAAPTLPDPSAGEQQTGSGNSGELIHADSGTLPVSAFSRFDPGNLESTGARAAVPREGDGDSGGPGGTAGTRATGVANPARAARAGQAGSPAAADASRPRTREEIAATLNVEERWPEVARQSGGVVADRQVIAYYGHPFSRFMGVLGETAIETMAEQLKRRAAEYDAINGEIGVAPAFHIIYGTVYEDASVGILREYKLLEYIEFARENGLIVFLDHQIGNGSVEDAIRAMLPYLRYDHVHLAFDPEWATERPGKEIGGVHADDINRAQQMMQDYLIERDLPGPRMLVVHQFNWRMIEERELVRSDFPMVQLIHHADGFGSPPDKRASWQFNVIAENIPLKGFKLFYPKSWRDGGYDDPLMSPAQVMQLEPVPVYIQYQ